MGSSFFRIVSREVCQNKIYDAGKLIVGDNSPQINKKKVMTSIKSKFRVLGFLGKKVKKFKNVFSDQVISGQCVSQTR